MRIMTSGGWIGVMLESLSIGVEDKSNVASVEMTLLFPNKTGLIHASLAMPDWIVHLNEEENDSERMLLGTISKRRAESLEERVADAMMGDLPGGLIKIDKMTSLEGQEVDVVASIGGVKRAFVQVVGERKVKVIGRLLGRTG